MNKSIDIDFFGDGMRIFLDYISRQHKKNPDYSPHPIIRAFECAIQGIDTVKVDECTIGVSQEGTKERIYEPYTVVLQKKENGIEVKEIRNLKVNKKLPSDVMVVLFRLQIQLDKINGETVIPQQAVDALNEVIPGAKFYALGDRWREARDEFKKQMELGRIQLPNDPKLLNDLKNIKYDTPWEDYSHNLRSLIGTSIAPSLDDEGGTVIITSPKEAKIEKFKIFDMATECILGKMAKYLKTKHKTE